MSFFNPFSSLWNTATSYVTATTKYLEANNVNPTTLTNFAKEVGVAAVAVTLTAAENVGQAVVNKATDAVNAVPALAQGAYTSAKNGAHSLLKGIHASVVGDAAVKEDASTAALVWEMADAAGTKIQALGHAGLKNTHAWTFGEATQKDASAATMAWELAGAAGNQALGLGYTGLKNIHAWTFGEAAQKDASAAAMAWELAGAAGSQALGLGYAAGEAALGAVQGSNDLLTDNVSYTSTIELSSLVSNPQPLATDNDADQAVPLNSPVLQLAATSTDTLSLQDALDDIPLQNVHDASADIHDITAINDNAWEDGMQSDALSDSEDAQDIVIVGAFCMEENPLMHSMALNNQVSCH